MNKYHVTYFYLASGQEGIPWTDDYGVVEANSDEEAKDITAIEQVPKDVMYGPDNKWSTRDFFKGCLQAKLITMHFKEVVYKRNFRVSVLDPYLYETVIATMAVNEGEDADLAFETAKSFVLEQGSKAVQYPDHQHIETNSLPPEPSVLPSIQVEKDKEDYEAVIDEINKCSTHKELQGWQAVSFLHSQSIKAYTEKLKQLQL